MQSIKRSRASSFCRLSEKKWARRLAATVLGAAVLPMAAQAAFPEHPITLVVPFPAGAGTDQTGRLLARCMESELPNSNVVVMNKPGASGAIGLQYVAQAKPDGYTLAIANTPGIVSLPIQGYKGFTLKSFDLLANIVTDPGTISVRSDSPIKNIKDLVAAARAKPGMITAGTQGVGSAGALSILLFEQAAGIHLQQVPYQGAAPASVALLGHVIDTTTANLGEAMTFAHGAPWTVLGVMATKRSQVAPDVPTFAEAGYPVQAGSMRALVGPKGLPKKVAATLEHAALQCQYNKDFLTSAKNSFQPLDFMDSKTLTTSLDVQDKQLREVWAKHPWQ